MERKEKCNSLKASELSCLDKKVYVKAYTEEMELFEDSEDDPQKIGVMQYIAWILMEKSVRKFLMRIMSG